tara:strand:+ start:833 stop:1267 length:435 start_codon:yes stop_codon:yes gene_type:complete
MRETEERWVYILKKRGHYMRNKEAALYELKETFDVMLRLMDEHKEDAKKFNIDKKLFLGQFEQYKNGEIKIPDMYYFQPHCTCQVCVHGFKGAWGKINLEYLKDLDDPMTEILELAAKPRPQKPVFTSYEEMMIWERENKYGSY